MQGEVGVPGKDGLLGQKGTMGPFGGRVSHCLALALVSHCQYDRCAKEEVKNLGRIILNKVYSLGELMTLLTAALSNN